METWGDLLSLKLQWKTISLRWWENLANESNNKKREHKNWESSFLFDVGVSSSSCVTEWIQKFSFELLNK